MTPYLTLSGRAAMPYAWKHSKYSDIPLGAIFTYESSDTEAYRYWLKVPPFTSSRFRLTCDCLPVQGTLYQDTRTEAMGGTHSYYWSLP